MNTLSHLFITLLLTSTCSNVLLDNKMEEFSAKLNTFEGVLMVSDDMGKSWKPQETSLPSGINIMHMNHDHESIFIGSSSAKLHTIPLNNLAKINTENVMSALMGKTPINENSVNGIFSCNSGVYVFVPGEGIFKKDKGKNFWKPLSTPEGFYHVDHIIEDEKGNIFMANHYGLYHLNNQGQSWERVFKKGFVTDLIMTQGSIFVNGVDGFNSSNDLGKTWNKNKDLHHKLNPTNDKNIQLFRANDRLYILSQQFQSLINTSSNINLVYTDDLGKTWKTHPAETFLKKQKNVQSIFIQNDMMYCSIDDVLMISADNGLTWKNIMKMPENEKNKTFKVFTTGEKLFCVKVDIGC